MAPEIHSADTMPCDAQVADIFSLGVLFFMLAFGVPPFASAELKDGFFSFLKARPDSMDFFKFHPHTRLLYRDGKIPEGFMMLLLAMLKADPSQRVQQVEQLLSFDFFHALDHQKEMNMGR